MTTFVVMGKHQWNKESYRDDAITAWLEAVNFNLDRVDYIGVYEIEAEPDQVSVDEMGCISYPKGAKLKKQEITFTDKMKSHIEKMERAMDQYEDNKYMLIDLLV